MDTHTHSSSTTGTVATRQAFGRARAYVAVYGALGAAVLAVVVVRAMTGHAVSSFMWGRSAGVLVSAAVAYWLTVAAARGARWAYVRVRIIAVVMPFAIVVIDVLPGTLPAWFIALQAVCAVAVGAAAVPLNGAGPRAAFRTAR
ncbi:hypothetical protein AB0A05_30835 [Streptomyces sp. NPDC046374]|uniref:hypothetical protein n=1 Tax=Streptomyces sp. NPDC046374 TaxID=3154917 RepID=UPI0033D92BEC